MSAILVIRCFGDQTSPKVRQFNNDNTNNNNIEVLYSARTYQQGVTRGAEFIQTFRKIGY